ncbi:hypothetical protein ACVW1C_005375 [Bradyrhizobium sp. USDA 4011]
MADAFRVRLWAILGEGTTGKSTVIGGLISQTGRGPGGPRHILLRGGGTLELNARRQSLQEAKRSPEKVVRETLELARKLQRRKGISIGYLNLLLAIRTDSINGLPRASDYLSHFVRSGWSLESLIVLDYLERRDALYFDFGAPLYPLVNAAKLARDRSQHEMLVGRARNHFGWA